MCRAVGKRISWDSKKARSKSIGYSPHHTPDLTLLHGAPDKSHILIDIVGPSVVSHSMAQAAASTPLAAATSAEGSKHSMFGDVAPHNVLPFAVEDGGALGTEATKFFYECREMCLNELHASIEGLQTWSARGFTNFFSQSFSVSNYRGLGHHLRIVGDTIRSGTSL